MHDIAGAVVTPKDVGCDLAETLTAKLVGELNKRELILKLEDLA